MIERRKIVEFWRSGRAAALATLVGVEGSSYRATGARLLIGDDGSYVGSISGGCLEAEIIRKAPWMVRFGGSVQRYSTLFDDTAEIPYGLGCGGTVDVLIEPADSAAFQALMDAMAASLTGVPRQVRTVLPADGRSLLREVRDEQGTVLFCSPEPSWRGSESFEELFTPPQRLLIFGAGDDAQPLVRMAAGLGWNVVVTDGRSQWARPARFPEAQLVRIAHQLEPLCVRQGDAVVLMTHSYEQDRNWLEQVLPCEPRYLGLLGSRHRSALLVAEAAATLGWSMEQACGGVFAPVGLDLGGDGAEAIALSVVAEVQACVQNKLGHSRRLTPEMVEAQIAQGGASRYLRSQCAL